MQLIRKLIRNRSLSGRNHKIRGLSTAELIGIIIIVGILGALGGTYIGSLVSTANKNAIAQNVQSLDTVTASILAGGVPVTDAGGIITNINGTAVADTATDATPTLTLLNAGVAGAVGTSSAGVSYKMTPPISAAALSADTYTYTVTDDGSGTVTSITWKSTGSTP
ncbi:MAG: hypothetical protein ACREFX_11825 [Opitutaceae bacterium]